MAATSPIRHKVYSKIPKGPDMELHIKVTRADGQELVNVRDFITSLKQYGRGVLFDAALLPRVIEELQELERQIGRQPAGVHPGQGKLFE
jgi:hypothetical protein